MRHNEAWTRFLDLRYSTVFLLPRCLFQDYENGRPVATYLCMSRSFLGSGNQIFMAGNPVSSVLPSLSLGTMNIIVCYVNNSNNLAGNQPLSSGSMQSHRLMKRWCQRI